MMQSLDLLPTSQIRAAILARHDAASQLSIEELFLSRTEVKQTGLHEFTAFFHYSDGTSKSFDGKSWKEFAANKSMYG